MPIEYEGFQSEDIRQFAQDSAKALIRAFQLYCSEVWGNAREEAPVDTGLLSGSLMLEKIDDLAYRIVTGVKYARIVHEGGKTPPHEILPVTKKALYWPGADHPVMRVMHPGSEIPANKFVDRAIDKADTRKDEFIRMAIAEVT